MSDGRDLVTLGEWSWERDGNAWVRTDGKGGDAADGSPLGVALSYIHILNGLIKDLGVHPTRDWGGVVVDQITTTSSYHPCAGPIREWIDLVHAQSVKDTNE